MAARSSPCGDPASAAGHEDLHGGDVLVIGEVARRDLYEAAERAEQRLRLPVNPVLCSRSRWIAAADRGSGTR